MRYANPLEAHCPECNLTIRESPNWFLEPGQVCPNCQTSLSLITEDMISASNEWKSYLNCVVISIEVEKRLLVEYEDKDFENRNFATVAEVIDLTLEVLGRKRKIYQIAPVREEIINIIRDMSAVQFEIKRETKLVELGNLW